MRLIISFLLTMLLCGIANSSYALDWKSLHDQAEETSLSEARSKLRNAPDPVENLYILGLVYLNKYNYTEALKAFQQILDIFPENIEARWGVAEVLRNNHNFIQCIPIFEDIIKTDPDFAPAYVSLAYIKYVQMNFKASSRLTGRVFKLNQQDIDVKTLVRAHSFYAAAKGMMAHYGGPLTKSANYFAVRKHLKIARELDPHSVAVYFGYGNYYMSIPSILGRDVHKAETFYRKTIEIDPHFADAYARLAQIYKSRGDLENYHTYLNKAFALDAQSEIALDIKNGTCKFICLDHN